VLSVAASSDGQLAASVSADKSLKLWGLDFGDMHRSLYAHTEPVTSVAWVPKTHYLFTAGKDGLIKHWDADAHALIHVLRGHHAEVWGLAVGRGGAHVVSVSRDKSLRLWARSGEQVFLEEEREAEVEAVMDASLEKQQQAAEAEEEEAAMLGLEGQAEAGAAGRRTLESVKGAERVLEALKTLDEEDDRVAEYEVALKRWQAAPGDRPRPALVPNLLLLNLSPSAYLLRALGGVRSAELEQALLLLPFDAVRGLLTRLLPLLEAEAPIELMARCVLYLLRVHHKAIVANRSLLETLQPLATALHARVARERATLGYNLAALGFVKRAVERAGGGGFFERGREAPAASVAELRRRTAARQEGGGGRKKRAAKVVG
jgi:U3 small nucleolar RNA-associated protein 12